MKLEQQIYEIPRIGKERIYQIGDLENLSATALYYGEGGGSSGFSGGIGSSSFSVILPKSNKEDKGIKISTPDYSLFINQYKRIKGSSGIDYFNPDGSVAGRIIGLNKSEFDYLED